MNIKVVQPTAVKKRFITSLQTSAWAQCARAARVQRRHRMSGLHRQLDIEESSVTLNSTPGVALRGSGCAESEHEDRDARRLPADRYFIAQCGLGKYSAGSGRHLVQRLAHPA